MATKGKSRAKKAPASLPGSWLTPARRREVIGAGLVVAAVVTLVGFPSGDGLLTARWIQVLRWLFGWAAPLFPLLMGGVGAALIIDAADGDVDVAWHQVAAAGAFYVLLLGLVHLVVGSRVNAPDLRSLAQAGAGGGYVGYWTSGLVSAALGRAPAVVALGLLSVTAVAMATGIALKDLAFESATLLRRTRVAVNDLAATRSLPDEIALELPAYRQPVEAAGAPEVAPAEVPPKVVEEVPAEDVHKRGRPGWRLAKIDDVLDPVPEVKVGVDDTDAKARMIEDALAEFGVPVQVVEINKGPTVTQFGVEPGYVVRAGKRSRVRVSRIIGLQNDLALALSASPLRIQAPVPGRPYVGIEVPNASAAMVTLRGVIETEAFRKVAAKGSLPIALGRDTSGHAVAADLATMPHLLIAGATGSGKSVALNAIVCCLLVTHTPDTLKMLLVDPKRVEMTQFRGLPHLGAPVVVDIERVVGVLEWAVREMDRRYRLFAEHGARNLLQFNETAARRGAEPMPYLVIVVDELADLMMAAPEEVERHVTRLAQLARATGIHLILATQRPSVDVVTGLIKANFPSRIAFAVASGIDSRVILDSTGAEKLLGRGDMLYASSDSSKLLRLQGCFVSEREIQRITRYWKSAVPRETTPGLEELEVPEPLIQAELWEEMIRPADEEDARDPLWRDALGILKEHSSASTSFLQRKLRIGYSRAARLIDELEEMGYIGPAHGNQPRPILVEFDGAGNVVGSPEEHEDVREAPEVDVVQG